MTYGYQPSKADHERVAQRAQNNPGKWIKLHVYTLSNEGSAEATAFRVRTCRHTAYPEPSQWDTGIAYHDDEIHLCVRYREKPRKSSERSKYKLTATAN